MTQAEKRFLAMISITLLILAGCILFSIYSRISRSISKDETADGYYFNTTCSQLRYTRNGNTITSAVTFTHSIYISEENPLADLTVTVTGIISPSECAITHLSAILSEEQWQGLSVSEHIANDTATVLLFQDQLSVCHFQYRISPDGQISILQ